MTSSNVVFEQNIQLKNEMSKLNCSSETEICKDFLCFKNGSINNLSTVINYFSVIISAVI